MLNAYYEKQGIERDYEVFRSKGFSPNWGITLAQGSIAMDRLPPFLRTLLVTDGTVTKALEAYYWEPVLVDAVSQKLVIAQAAIDWLNVRVGDEVLARRVNLRGGTGQAIYAKAFSVIRCAALPAHLRSQLLDGALGIGELIRDCGLETYRELLEIGWTSPRDELDPGDTQRGFIHRSYRIALGGQPVILVTEHFPLDTFHGSRA